MKTSILTLMAFVVLTACTKNANNCEAEDIKNCFTTLEYDPVCGCDGVTYPNSGTARCNSITEFTKGPCGFQGDFVFLGFESDGAQVGKDEQKYSGNSMTLSLNQDQDNDVLSPFKGQGQPNVFEGKYHVDGKNFKVLVLTEAAGSAMEDRYLEALAKVASITRKGDYLEMTISEDKLVFKSK
jgi:hypothetical protein